MRSNPFIAACFLMLLADQNASADLVIFEFTGTLAEGRSWHSQIQGGETWVAEFVIDRSLPDQYPDDPTWGWYDNSVVSGSLSFSGGYSQQLDTTGWEANVFDNFELTDPIPNVYFDGVSVYDQYTPVNFFVQAHFESFSPDIDLIIHDGIPDPGFEFSSQGISINYYQLGWRDQITGEYVIYNAIHDVNTSFRVRSVAVPEPSHFAAIGAITASLLGLSLWRFISSGLFRRNSKSVAMHDL